MTKFLKPFFALVMMLGFMLLKPSSVSAQYYPSIEDCQASGCSNCQYERTIGPGESVYTCADEAEGIKNPALSNKLGQGEGAESIAELIATALKIAYSIAGLVLLAMLLSGGIGLMTAGGDKGKVEAAQGRISSAIIGFIIFMSVFVIINFIAPALGLGFLQILTIEWPTIL